jgi:hypothetical protein
MTCNRLVKGVFVLVTVAGVFASTTRAAADKDKAVVGTWKLEFNPGDGDHKATLTVTMEKSGLKAKFVDGDKKIDVTKITFKDGKLTFSTRSKREGSKATATFEGKVKGDAIKGKARWKFQGMEGSFDFEGKRQAAKPKG